MELSASAQRPPRADHLAPSQRGRLDRALATGPEDHTHFSTHSNGYVPLGLASTYP
jgi:hypothetical protein